MHEYVDYGQCNSYAPDHLLFARLFTINGTLAANEKGGLRRYGSKFRIQRIRTTFGQMVSVLIVVIGYALPLSFRRLVCTDNRITTHIKISNTQQ